MATATRLRGWQPIDTRPFQYPMAQCMHLRPAGVYLDFNFVLSNP